MSTVYVVQKQMRFDKEKGELVPRFDLSSALQYGELDYLLSPSAAPWTGETVLPELRKKLASYTREDHLLLVGNPCLIGWVVAIAAQVTGGYVSLLQWHGKEQRYINIENNIYDDYTEQ